MNLNRTRQAIPCLLILLVAACSLLNPGPAGTVKKFYAYVEKGEISSATKLLNLQPGMEGMISASLPALTEEIKAKGGIKSLSVTNEDTTGDTSKLTFTLTFGNGTTKNDSEKLIRKDGKWLMQVQK